MPDEFDRLVEKGRSVSMTPEQWEEQRRSFAYGNAKLENDYVTREMVDQQADLLEAESDTGDSGSSS